MGSPFGKDDDGEAEINFCVTGRGIFKCTGSVNLDECKARTADSPWRLDVDSRESSCVSKVHVRAS